MTPCYKCRTNVKPTIKNTNLVTGLTYCDECLTLQDRCVNCKLPVGNGHYVSPSFGEDGFFICEHKL